MKLVASQELACHPRNIAYLPGGEVAVLASHEESSFLEVYDGQLSPVWNARLERRARALLLAAEGTPWVLDEAGALAIQEQGRSGSRVEAPARENLHLAAFTQVEQDFIFVWEHDIGAPMHAPAVARVQKDGQVCWPTTLPVRNIAYKGVVQMRAEEGWKPRPVDAWKPETWLSTPKPLAVSGDALLTCFSEMPRSGIGFGYVLSLSDGVLRFVTQKGPISEVAPLGGGAFLVGYQGYGAFKTLRYEPDGSVKTRWASHGYYVIRDGDVRVVEMENVLPSRMHLARLLPGGAVTKGAWLDGYYTSRPFLREDGALFFFRNGVLWAAQDLSIDEKLMLCSPDNGLYSTRIVGGGQGLYFAYTRSSARDSDTRLVRVSF